MEYALLVGVSVVIFLALGTAANVFSATAEDDAMAITAYQVAMKISSSTCDAVGSGDVSVVCKIDLPEQICNMPYLAYLSPDDHNICVSVSGHTYCVPVPLRASGVRISGFIASISPEHIVVFDASTGTVTLS